MRDHLGVETQRHREAIRPEGRKREGACEGSNLAIARTTPCLLGLFSLVVLLGKQLTQAWCMDQGCGCIDPNPVWG